MVFSVSGYGKQWCGAMSCFVCMDAFLQRMYSGGKLLAFKIRMSNIVYFHNLILSYENSNLSAVDIARFFKILADAMLNSGSSQWFFFFFYISLNGKTFLFFSCWVCFRNAFWSHLSLSHHFMSDVSFYPHGLTDTLEVSIWCLVKDFRRFVVNIPSLLQESLSICFMVL